MHLFPPATWNSPLLQRAISARQRRNEKPVQGARLATSAEYLRVSTSNLLQAFRVTFQNPAGLERACLHNKYLCLTILKPTLKQKPFDELPTTGTGNKFWRVSSISWKYRHNWSFKKQTTLPENTLWSTYARCIKFTLHGFVVFCSMIFLELYAEISQNLQRRTERCFHFYSSRILLSFPPYSKLSCSVEQLPGKNTITLPLFIRSLR